MGTAAAVLDCKQEIAPSRLSSGHTICNTAGMNIEGHDDNNSRETA